MSENAKPDHTQADATADATQKMAALASDVCTMWQEHLAAVAADPAAKAELAQMLEPQRQAMTKLFADYTAMMQHAPHVHQQPHAPASGGAQHAPHEGAKPAPASEPAAPSHGAAPAAAASDDSALRMAQLAHRVAVLEERLARIETRLESRPASRSRRTAKPASEQSGDGDS